MEHLIKAYDAELLRLKGLLVEMGKLTIEQLESVLGAVANAEAAARIVEREPEADRRVLEIDHMVVDLLAMRQPVAVDLREVLSALKIAQELESICDHAEDSAKRVMAIRMTPREAQVTSVANLGRFAATIVKDAMHSYEAANADQAQQVWHRRKELGEMYAALLRELLMDMMADPHRITEMMQLVLIAGDIERTGARATNIAEMVHYWMTGSPPKLT